jgi:hypothetical protein
LLRDNAIAGAADANDALWISFGEISDLGREIRIGVVPSIKARETPVRALGDFSRYRECLGDAARYLTDDVAAIQVDQQPDRWPSTFGALRNGHLNPEAAIDVSARLDRSVEFVGPFKFRGAPDLFCPSISVLQARSRTTSRANYVLLNLKHRPNDLQLAVNLGEGARCARLGIHRLNIPTTVQQFFLVSAEAETAEPHADIHDRALTWG